MLDVNTAKNLEPPTNTRLQELEKQTDLEVAEGLKSPSIVYDNDVDWSQLHRCFLC